MGNLLQDLRFTFRQLRKTPSFAITAVLTLALGIGANTAIFSLVNSILIKPLPVPHAEQLMTLVPRQNQGLLEQTFSLPEFKAMRAESSRSFSTVIAYAISLDGFAVAGQQPQRIMTCYTSGNFFSGLGLKPPAGRLFLPSEGETVGSDPVMVLGYNYWQQKFNGDPGIVGRAVTLDGHPFTIVGVAPKGFPGLQAALTMDAYLPLSELPIAGTPADALTNWQNRMFIVNARLRPDSSLSQANAELSLVAGSIMRQHPDVEKKLTIAAFPEPSLRINPGNPRTMYVVAGLFLSLAVMVLLLACVNVANLVLVRATVREREMAIRSALGARRSRLMLQMITESVVLALMGGAAGVGLGMWASNSLSYFLNLHSLIPINLAFAFDWRIFLYSFLIASLAGLVVGLVPAVRMAWANVNTVLHEGGRGITAGHHWVRDGLVALQIAGSLVLLVVAGLFVRSLSAIETMDFGFNPDHVLNFVIDTNEVGVTGTQSRDLAANITARLHQLPGVDAVSHASSLPFGYFGNSDQMMVDGAPVSANPAAPSALYGVVSPEYFQVMGIRLERGRAFTDADNDHGMDAAVISESTARKYWPNQDALGRTFRMGSEKDRQLEVVGIAGDAEFQLFNGGRQAPYFYIPYAQHVKGNTLMVFQIRTEQDQDPLVLIPTVEQTLHEVAPQLPVFQVQTMRQAMYTLNGLLLFQIGATLAGILGGLGLTLAVIGLYGVVSYAVSVRVHEIGLRMALGASRGGVFRMIYRQSLLMIAAGLGIGLAVALLAARTVGGFVVVSVWDPATYAAVAAVLAMAALASCYPPARRAMTVEPMVALRED
jgi:macrolide transport system ATP-binding/permease protein